MGKTNNGYPSEKEWEDAEKEWDKEDAEVEKINIKRMAKMKKKTVDNPVWMNKLKKHVMDKMMIHLENNNEKEKIK